MVFFALLLAAAVQVAPPSDTITWPQRKQVRVASPDRLEPWAPTPEAARVACPGDKILPAVDNVRQYVQPLAEAAPGRLQYAVLRSVGGCPVPTFVVQTRPAR
ncbi:MAG: hypothetical protein PSX79_09950 [bacterium]|nr:hypothetical protein [bacterium]